MRKNRTLSPASRRHGFALCLASLLIFGGQQDAVGDRRSFHLGDISTHALVRQARRVGVKPATAEKIGEIHFLHYGEGRTWRQRDRIAAEMKAFGNANNAALRRRPPEERSLHLFMHSFGYHPWVIKQLPDALRIDQRPLLSSILNAAQNPRRRVLVAQAVATDAPTVDFNMAYAGRFWRSPNLKRRAEILDLADPSPQPLANKILGLALADGDWLSALARKLPTEDDDAILKPYMVRPHDAILALMLGIPLDGPSPVFSFLGSASEARKVFARTHIPHPAGRNGIRGKRELIHAIYDLLSKHPNADFMGKTNFSTGGTCIRLFEISQETRRAHQAGKPRRSVYELIARDLEQGPQLDDGSPNLTGYFKAAKREGMTVAVYEGENLPPPSVQALVQGDGTISIEGLHRQDCGGQIGTCYQGAWLGGLDPHIAKLMYRHVTKFAQWAVQLGARHARVNLDAILLPNGRLKQVECNFRHTSTTLAMEIACALTGGRFDPQSQSIVTPSGQRRYYYVNAHANALKGALPWQMIAAALSSGSHYHPGAGEGFIWITPRVYLVLSPRRERLEEYAHEMSGNVLERAKDWLPEQTVPDWNMLMDRCFPRSSPR